MQCVVILLVDRNKCICFVINFLSQAVSVTLVSIGILYSFFFVSRKLLKTNVSFEKSIKFKQFLKKYGIPVFLNNVFRQRFLRKG